MLSKDTFPYLKEFVYGGIDGCVTTFAVVAGATGAGLNSGIIIILGFANLIADGFSMSVGNYLSGKSGIAAERNRTQSKYKISFSKSWGDLFFIYHYGIYSAVGLCVKLFECYKC